MAQETIRHLQIFRNDNFPLIGAPDVIKARVKTLLSDSTSAGIHIKDGEFIDVRYYKGRYELSQGTPSTFVWKVLTVQNNTETYVDPTTSGITDTIHQYGVVTGLTGVGISVETSGTNIYKLNTTGQANDIQWLDESVASNIFNVESGSANTDVVKVYVTENPDGNFIVTSAIDWTNLASHLTFTHETDSETGEITYTLKGGDDTSSLNISLASFTVAAGISADNFVQKGTAIYGVKWANLSSAEQTAWSAASGGQYVIDSDGDNTPDYALYYSGCEVGGTTYTSQSTFIDAMEHANKGVWLLKLEIGTTPSDIESIVYVPIPDFTYLVSGAVSISSDTLTLTNDDGSTITIDISGLKNINSIDGDYFGSETDYTTTTGNGDYVRVKATTTTDASTGEKSTALVSQTKNSNVTYAGDGIAHTAANDELAASDGLLTYAAVETIEHYIDQYDCGTYTITLS